MLEALDLTAVRGDRTLFTALNFSLSEGELLYVNGPNGSGKTTLLRLLCGLMQPAAGTIRWQGADIAALGDEYKKDLLYLGHLPAIKDDLNGLENLMNAATLSGQALPADDALAALSEMGLAAFIDLPARVLSQGQKRRIALARLCRSRARLWVLDEPFVALDRDAVVRLQKVIDAHLQRRGSVVLTTHQRVEIDAARVRELGLGT